jgi:hypothetical protein
MREPTIQELNAMATTVSFDMLNAIDQMAQSALTDLNWARYTSGEGFQSDRAQIVLFKLQAQMQMLRQMIANVKTK